MGVTAWRDGAAEVRERRTRDRESGRGEPRARGVAVYQQGSYRNRTNVRIDSDVDLGLLCRETFFYDLPDNATAAQLGLTEPVTYPYTTYKNDVGAALVDHLGSAAVTRGDKAFDVHENTYRVDADVVPCFPYRFYQADGSYIEGRAFLTDAGRRIINYPEQNYTNGVAKNDRTRRGFKASGGVALEVAGRRLRGPVGAYAEGGDGEPAVIVGSTGRLEIFVRAGSARDNLGAGRGAIVRVRRAE